MTIKTDTTMLLSPISAEVPPPETFAVDDHG